MGPCVFTLKIDHDIHDLVDLDGFGGDENDNLIHSRDQTQRHQGKGIEVRAWTLGSEGREGSGRRGSGRCRPCELRCLGHPKESTGAATALVTNVGLALSATSPCLWGPMCSRSGIVLFIKLVSGYILYLYLLYLTLNSLTCLTSFSGGSKTVTYLTYPNW